MFGRTQALVRLMLVVLEAMERALRCTADPSGRVEALDIEVDDLAIEGALFASVVEA